MSIPLAARSVTSSTLDFLAANLAAFIFRAAESVRGLVSFKKGFPKTSVLQQ